MIDIIVGLIIIVILALATGYIVRAKKAGVQCIGCSCGGSAKKTTKSDQPTQSTGCGGGCSSCEGCSCGH